jgi:SPP1 gp7 family putative phage head morphogenesis protein
MNSNDKIFDRIVDHMGDVRLYEEGVQLQNRRILKRHRNNLKDLLRGDIRADINKEVNRFGKELTAHKVASLKEFSTTQLDFSTNNLYKEVKGWYKVQRPRTKELLGEITGPNIKGTRSITQNVKNISSGELVRIQSKVKRGLAEGTSKNVIIKDVMKTTKITEHQAKTLTRTAITSTQTTAVHKVMERNKDILKGFMFTAILDSKTSPICTHHNGKVYDVDDKRYTPPLHWNCRSSMVPVLKSKEDLLEESSARINKTELKKKDPQKLNGLQPKDKGYGEWLKGQAFDVQKKMLGGEEQANLFRTGALKANEFVTPKGKALSIQALRARATASTAVYKPKRILREQGVRVEAKTPNSLLNNPKHRADLQNMFILDSSDYQKTMSLTDYKGVSLQGKQDSRRRLGNQFDEKNFSADPLTGEVRNNKIYDPDFNLYQERIDFMRNAKDLSLEQKDFIENMATSLTDKVSVNQQTVVIENLRVVFQRYAKDKTPWGDFTSVVRAENRFAVQNVSRLLDVRSRQRSEMFVSYLAKDKPQVQIMGKYYTLDDLQKNLLKDQRYIDAWRSKEGTKLARKLYFKGRAPMNTYFQSLYTKYPTKAEFKDKLLDNVIPLRKEYKAFKKRFNREPSDSWYTKKMTGLRSSYRGIVDLEFLNRKPKPSSKIMNDDALNSITKSVKLITSGQSTDYDSLAIAIGKQFEKDFGKLLPLETTLKSYHKSGSKILKEFQDQGLIKVSFRGKTRRGVLDLDTGRASGGFADTISREVTIIDKNLLKLQEAERRTVIARRLGTVEPRDRLYVQAGKKTFVDARGNDTGIPIISADKFPDYDAKQIDREMASMMNHVSNTEYQVDGEFFDFMDDVVRFRDPRGNSKYYDSINELRHEILNRGEQGYGLMTTAKWHRQRNKPFKTNVFIDSRGRVYHRGYLTPTGGELVRPFLDSGQSLKMTPLAMQELRIQVGAMIGPATEALTQAGRFAIFERNKDSVLELGELLMKKTQRDRRMREFLEHPLIKGHEGPHVPKMARFALEYARIHKKTGGKFDAASLSKYQTRLMIENDASSSGAQIIGLSTGDRQISMVSNVLATPQKNRLYDIIAQDTINDPDFLKIPALRDAGLTWEELAKGAKSQNMVSFYGAGDATKTANVAGKMAKILDSKGYASVTKDTLGEQLRIIDGKIKVADRLGATATVDELRAFRGELNEMINKSTPVGRELLKQAQDIHPDTAKFVEKLMNAPKGLVGPKDFAEISRIMSKNLAIRAPVTDNFITFWKKVAKEYVQDTGKVDIPWVTFDGKVMTQRYRPKIQERIEFTDPVTGRKIANIYEASAEDGKLLGKSSIQDASIGLGVNGNHSNDAVIVRRFHLWGKKNNVGTGTIHDAFFTNIGHAEDAKQALRTIYADALDGDTIRKTLKKMRDEGLSGAKYREFLALAKEQGLIDPPNKITRKDILADIPEGEDWYGIGP